MKHSILMFVFTLHATLETLEAGRVTASVDERLLPGSTFQTAASCQVAAKNSVRAALKLKSGTSGVPDGAVIVALPPPVVGYVILLRDGSQVRTRLMCKEEQP